MKIFVVIAAYNEQKKIAAVLKDLKSYGYNHIIVVDDGSKDKTADIAKREGAILLQHIINRGQGAALKTGIETALREKADIIITFDADGQHQASDLKNLTNPIIKGEADIALGSRFLKKNKDTPLIRKLFLKGGAFIIYLMYGVRLTDSHNGLRALSRKAAEKIDLKSNGMEHASEIIDEIKRKELRYKEIPVNIRYTDYSKKHGQSSLNAFKILFRMIIKKITG